MLGTWCYLSVLKKKESELIAKKSEISTPESDLDILEAEKIGEKKAVDATINDKNKKSLDNATSLQANIY